MPAAERAASIRVEVLVPLPDRQLLRCVRVPAGASVRDAVAAAGLSGRSLLAEFPDPRLVGRFGRRVGLADTVRDGDRIELQRPLQADPKTARRNRAGARAGKPR